MATEKPENRFNYEVATRGCSWDWTRVKVETAKQAIDMALRNCTSDIVSIYTLDEEEKWDFQKLEFTRYEEDEEDEESVVAKEMKIEFEYWGGGKRHKLSALCRELYRRMLGNTRIMLSRQLPEEEATCDFDKETTFKTLIEVAWDFFSMWLDKDLGDPGDLDQYDFVLYRDVLNEKKSEKNELKSSKESSDSEDEPILPPKHKRKRDKNKKRRKENIVAPLSDSEDETIMPKPKTKKRKKDEAEQL